MKRPVPLLLASFFAFAGCSSHRELSTDQRNANDAITKAEDAGAKRYAGESLASAKEDVKRARVAEDAALRDRRTARDNLAAARRRDDRARKRIQSRKATLDEDEEERKTQGAALDALRTHADELRAKGVTDEEVASLVDTRESMIKIRMKQLESEIDSLKHEIAAMENVRKDAALEIQTAQARLKTAEDRLAAAQALYAQVEERANLARAEAMDARRDELSRKIGALSP